MNPLNFNVSLFRNINNINLAKHLFYTISYYYVCKIFTSYHEYAALFICGVECLSEDLAYLCVCVCDV